MVSFNCSSIKKAGIPFINLICNNILWKELLIEFLNEFVKKEIYLLAIVELDISGGFEIKKIDKKVKNN